MVLIRFLNIQEKYATLFPFSDEICMAKIVAACNGVLIVKLNERKLRSTFYL